MDEYRFRVKFLEEANDFLGKLDQTVRDKIFYNIWKVRSMKMNDKELFKKLQNNTWEFRTSYNRTHYRLLAFWDKTSNVDTVVVSTHGFVKKTDKTPQKEIDRAEKLRMEYFNDKNNENV